MRSSSYAPAGSNKLLTNSTGEGSAGAEGKWRGKAFRIATALSKATSPNTLIVFGLVAFDNAVAILNAFPLHFPSAPALPSPVLLVKSLLLPAGAYDEDRIQGLA